MSLYDPVSSGERRTTKPSWADRYSADNRGSGSAIYIDSPPAPCRIVALATRRLGDVLHGTLDSTVGSTATPRLDMLRVLSCRCLLESRGCRASCHLGFRALRRYVGRIPCHRRRFSGGNDCVHHRPNSEHRGCHCCGCRRVVVPGPGVRPDEPTNPVAEQSFSRSIYWPFASKENEPGVCRGCHGSARTTRHYRRAADGRIRPACGAR